MALNIPRWLLISLLTLVLLIVSMVPTASGAQGLPVPATASPPAAPATAAADASVAERTYQGFTRPSRQTAVACRVAGLVEKVLVSEGQAVKAGQPLLQLDATVEKLETELSRMASEDGREVEAARLVASQAEAELRRAEALVAQSAITETELEQKRLAVKVARLRVSAAEAGRVTAGIRYQRDLALLAQRTVTAPADGIVRRILKQPGEAVERLETVLELVQLDPLEIVLNLPADSRPLYRVGQTAGVVLQNQDEGCEAEVTGIEPTIDFASGTYRLTLQLPNPEGRLSSGVRVTVTLAAAGELSGGAKLPARP